MAFEETDQNGGLTTIRALRYHKLRSRLWDIEDAEDIYFRQPTDKNLKRLTALQRDFEEQLRSLMESFGPAQLGLAGETYWYRLACVDRRMEKGDERPPIG